MFELNGRVAVVTGAAMGMGAAIAQELAACNAVVAVTDINLEAAQNIVAKIKRAGGRAEAFHHNVVSAKSCAELALMVETNLGVVDILVNNAGVVSFTPFAELTEEKWDFVLDVNLKGQFLTTKAFIAGMIKRQYGRIINMGSVVSKRGHANIAHYASSKFAILGFTQSLASEYATLGITANTVCPGIVMTPLHERVVKEMAEVAGTSLEEALDSFIGLIPQKRPQTPGDVARMVAYLASDLAANMTGSSYHIDGGMEMR